MKTIFTLLLAAALLHQAAAESALLQPRLRDTAAYKELERQRNGGALVFGLVLLAAVAGAGYAIIKIYFNQPAVQGLTTAD